MPVTVTSSCDFVALALEGSKCFAEILGAQPDLARDDLSASDCMCDRIRAEPVAGARARAGSSRGLPRVQSERGTLYGLAWCAWLDQMCLPMMRRPLLVLGSCAVLE